MSVRRIRVLQVITSLAGGAGLHAYQLTRHLDTSRFDVKLVFGPGYPLDEVVEREQLPHAKLAWTRRLDPLAMLRGTYELARILRAGCFDIVHAHCSLAGALGRLLARRETVPCVLFTVHAFASRDYQPSWRKRLSSMLERWLDRYTDCYLVGTGAIADQIIAKRIGTRDRVRIVPLGIEVPPAPSAAERQRARSSLGLADDELAVAMAGRLEHQKGVTYLLRAFVRVRHAVPAARLIIFGDGPLLPSLQTEARRVGLDGAVTFAGWRVDLPVLLPGIDVFCLPSLWESFGYVLLDAMAANLPIVATRVEGVPEVTGEGECAVLVPPADEDALATALVAMLQDSTRRATLAAAGRARVEREYTLTQMVSRIENLYREMAPAAPARGKRANAK